jgi:site-specific DNA recombinase
MAAKNIQTGSSKILVQSALGDAAIYARQSRTDDSKADKVKREQKVETTLDTQTAACIRDANKRGYSVPKDACYTERYTGAEMWDRPVLSELRRRIKNRDYRALFVYSTDRLARDPIHLALILEECQRANCELVFVTEPLEDSPEGELILYIKGYAAKIERLRIKDRMARGRNAIIAAGKLTCQGTASYGFKFDPANRVRVIDEETAPIVRDIYRWTIEGMSAHAIAERLRSMRLPCPAEYAGKKFKAGPPIWSNSAISRILNDDAYTGKTYVNKFKVTETRHKKSGRYFAAQRDRKEWKTLPAGVTPAIISQETYDAARKACERNKKRSDFTRNSKRPVLLRGFVFCGKCQAALYPMSETTHRTDVPNRAVYKCSTSRLKRSMAANGKRPDVCNPKRLIAADLECAVWDKLVSFLLAPDVIAKEVERVLSTVPDLSLASDLRAAEAQVTKARRVRDAALTKYEDAIADGDDELAERWDAKAKEANSDVKALASVIKDLTNRLGAYSNSGKTARAFAKQCKQIMASGSGDFTFEEKRAALEALNVKVFAADGLPVRMTVNTAILTEQTETQVTVEVTA